MMGRAGNASRCAVSLVALLASVVVPAQVRAQGNPPYTTYASIAELMTGDGAQYPKLLRISEPGTQEGPAYTGFFFYQCLQFDPTDRYVLGMRVHCQNRDVRPTDRGEIGVIDLQDGHKWTQIGETTAWNWQQGARLQWRPGSSEILWNDRSDDGSHYVCRVYDFKTGVRRTLPRPIYTPSPDGSVALTHDFERMKHGGTPYVGIEDKYADQYAPKETGIWRMDLNTGEAALIMSLDQMARIAYPQGAPSSGCFYIFREGWNPCGSRFIAFVKDPDNKYDRAFSMTAKGEDVRCLHDRPSHHEWRDDDSILDGRGYYLYPDNGTGKAESRLFESSQNGHVSYIPRPGGDWIVSDTYAIDGYQYLFLYHIPTRQFVPLAKLKSTAPTNTYRVDLHPRLSRSGRRVSIDATHEGLGRQMYIMDIGYILDHPPGKLTPDQVRTGAWGSVMGGTFYLYAECFEPTLTWGDGSAFGSIEIMRDFLGGLAYWKLKPEHALVNSGSLCLADPGHEYVVYRQSGGTLTLDLSIASVVFQAEWLDPRTRARKAAAIMEGGAKQSFTCPDTRDWVLHLSREG